MDNDIKEVTDLGGSKYYTVLFVIIFLIGVTIVMLIGQVNEFENCKNKEHSTCPVFNCAVTDYIGDDYCMNNAMRFDANGKKICSGSISS